MQTLNYCSYVIPFSCNFKDFVREKAELTCYAQLTWFIAGSLQVGGGVAQ